jgi:hypothetical protein
VGLDSGYIVTLADPLLHLMALSCYFSFPNNSHIGRKIAMTVICKQRYLVAVKYHFANCKRVGQVSYITVAEEHNWYSNDPMPSLDLAFDPSEDSFGFFNQLLELYSSTFSTTTTTLDLWLDQEFVRTATTNGSFPAFHTFNYFTNVKTLNLLEQSPLSVTTFPTLFPS